MAKPMVSMKLLIDRRGKRVVFAEAEKECADFLFQLLSLPVATIVGLLGEEGMEGCLPNLYQSLEDLNKTYILPRKDKNALLNPVPTCSIPVLAIGDASTQNTSASYWSCPKCYEHISSYKRQRVCYNCSHKLAPEEGLVTEVVTYMVMDDLEVKPMSTVSTVALLSKFGVKEASDLEEKWVDLGMDQAIELLKASLQSDNVLTELFC